MQNESVMKEWGFSTSTITSWVFTIPCTLGSTLFVGFYLTLILFILFIMFIGWMVHVNFIKFPYHLVPGSPIPILAISDNTILWFIDSPGLSIYNSLNITLVGVPSFSVGAGLGSFTSSYLKYCKNINVFFLNQIDELLVQEILHPWGLSWSILLLLPCYCTSR